jgi:gluconate 5-dehydrogenase
MALGFAERGANLFLCSRTAEELEATANEITTASDVRVEYAVADLSKRDGITTLVAAANDSFDAIDILVNNAGSNNPQVIDSIEDEAWDEIVQLNLSSCMALTRAFVPSMRSRQ